MQLCHSRRKEAHHELHRPGGLFIGPLHGALPIEPPVHAVTQPHCSGCEDVHAVAAAGLFVKHTAEQPGFEYC